MVVANQVKGLDLSEPEPNVSSLKLSLSKHRCLISGEEPSHYSKYGAKDQML